MHPQRSFDKAQVRAKPTPAYRPHDHLAPGRPARNDDERAARRAEIERRYAKPLKDCSDQRRIAVLRRRDLENLCRASDVPEDGGLDWLDIAANHLAFIHSKADAKIAAILRWRARFTPMVEVGTATELAERIIADPRMPKADELAHRLGLTMARRTELGITTIGAIDCGKAKRAALRRKRNNAAKRARRAKAGAAPHAMSVAKLKPWMALGISRATYYRHRQNETDETNSGTAHAKHVGLSVVATVNPLAPVCRAPGAPSESVVARVFGGDVPEHFRARMVSLAATLRLNRARDLSGTHWLKPASCRRAHFFAFGLARALNSLRRFDHVVRASAPKLILIAFVAPIPRRIDHDRREFYIDRYVVRRDVGDLLAVLSAAGFTLLLFQFARFSTCDSLRRRRAGETCCICSRWFALTFGFARLFLTACCICSKVSIHGYRIHSQRLGDGAVRYLRLQFLDAGGDLLALVRDDPELIELDGVDEGVDILEAAADRGPAIILGQQPFELPHCTLKRVACHMNFGG